MKLNLGTLFSQAIGAAVLVAVAAPALSQSILIAEGANDRVRQASWPSGSFITNFIPSAPSGLDLPIMVKVGPDGMIYLTAQGSVHSVRRYLPNSSATSAEIDPSFTLPPGGTLVSPVGLAFHPSTGHMYVSDIGQPKIVVYDLNSSTIVTIITSAGLTSPTGMSFDAAGNLYVCDWNTNAVLKLPNNSTTLVPCVTMGTGGLIHPEDVLVQGSQLYVTSFGTSQVLRYSATSGASSGIEAPTGSETLSNVLGLTSDSNGDIFVSCNDTGRVEQYKPLGQGHVGTFCIAAGPIGLCFFKEAVAPFPVRAHEVVATYCPDVVAGVPSATGPCVKLVDARTGGPTGTNWLAPMFSNLSANPLDPNAWIYQNLGPVFAVTVDDAAAPNIFVAATTAYGQFPFGPGGGGGVYKLGGCDGSIYPWIVTGAPVVNGNKLPNTHGMGLGDITFDRWHHQFFVSNMDDGKIYRFKDAGTTAKLIDSWDPFGAHLDSNGIPVLGDRIWALHVFGDACYQFSSAGRFMLFSVWLRDGVPPSPNAHTTTAWPAWLPPLPSGVGANNALFTVALDSTGAIVPTSVALFRVMPYLGDKDPLKYSNPVSDITSSSRYIFTAEKTMTGAGIPGVLGSSHYARTLRFAGTSTNDLYKVGDVSVMGLKGTNSAGGVGLDVLQFVWSTGDALQYPNYTIPFTNDRVYGLQRFALGGNLLSTPSFSTITKLIDLDKDVSVNDKVQPGDVEVIQFNANTVNCPAPGGGNGHNTP